MPRKPARVEVRLDREDPYLRLLCINIFVRDQDRSLRFYIDLLGFSLVLDESYEGVGRWIAVAPPDGNTVLALITPQRKSEEYKLIGRSKHAVLVTEDVTAKYEKWNKRGVRFHHPPQTKLLRPRQPRRVRSRNRSPAPRYGRETGSREACGPGTRNR